SGIRGATLVNALCVCESEENRMFEDSRMNRANALCGSVASGALLRVLALAGIASIGAALPASAQSYYWHDTDNGYFAPRQVVQPPPRRNTRAARKGAAKKETQVKDSSAHPQM